MKKASYFPTINGFKTIFKVHEQKEAVCDVSLYYFLTIIPGPSEHILQ
jgi:hypothetical protein